MRTIQEVILKLPGTPEYKDHINHALDVEAKVDDFLHRLDAELGGVAGISEVTPAPCCTRSSQRPQPARQNPHIDAVMLLGD